MGNALSDLSWLNGENDLNIASEGGLTTAPPDPAPPPDPSPDKSPGKTSQKPPVKRTGVYTATQQPDINTGPLLGSTDPPLQSPEESAEELRQWQEKMEKFWERAAENAAEGEVLNLPGGPKNDDIMGENQGSGRELSGEMNESKYNLGKPPPDSGRRELHTEPF